MKRGFFDSNADAAIALFCAVIIFAAVYGFGFINGVGHQFR